MAPASSIKQRMTCNFYLFQKLLNLQDGTSPFTLVIDSLEQSSIPLIKEFGRRAKTSDTNVIFISFTIPLRKIPIDFTAHIKARGKSLSSLQQEALSYLKTPSSNASTTKNIFIIDSLLPIASRDPEKLPSFLNSLIISPAVSLIGIYHVDIPIIPSDASYSPNPLTTLIFMATAVLTVSSLSQTISRKRAKDKSLPEPRFGLEERKEGILIGLDGPKKYLELVVCMELRRRSGRGIREEFVLKPSSSPTSSSSFILLDNHPDYATLPVGNADDLYENKEVFRTTFNMELTEKQKKDRQEVILPYYDAQREGGCNGPGEGGRILYQMGSEDRDDFDEDEDEL